MSAPSFEEFIYLKARENDIPIGNLKSSFKSASEAMDVMMGDATNEQNAMELYKPYNFSCPSEFYLSIKSTEEFSFGVTREYIVEIMEQEIKNRELYLAPEITAPLIETILSLGAKSFIKKCERYDKYIKSNRKYHEISALIAILSDKKAKNFGDQKLWTALEVLISLLIIFLIDGETLNTGQFSYSNAHLKANFILNKNKDFIKKSSAPNWLKRSLEEVGYLEGSIPIVPFYHLFQSFFHFYDAMIYKHSLKLFDQMIISQCRHSSFMTNFFRDIELTAVEKDFQFFGIDSATKIKEYVSHKRSIFFQTAFVTISNNIYLGTELLTENGRKLLVFGSNEAFGKFIVELNLSDVEKQGSFKFYSMVYDWMVGAMPTLANEIIVETLISYIYMAMAEIGETEKLKSIKVETVPHILVYDKHEKIYEGFSILQSEYREVAPLIRRLPVGHVMSEEAMAFAKQMNYHVPEGYTFVREYEKRVRVKVSEESTSKS